MNTETNIVNEQVLLNQLDPALQNLHRHTGVEGKVVAYEQRMGPNQRVDAVIDIGIEGQPCRYNVEAKTRVDRLAALGQIKAQLDRLDGRGLLFTPYITPAIAKKCREIDLPFLDAIGNAYLHQPGLHIFITGEKPEGGITPNIGNQAKGGTATALRVIFTLLCQPKFLNAPYREIVDAAGVALGAVGWVFFDLKARGLIAGGQKQRDRRFQEPVRLFEEWVTNYPIKLRPKLNPRRFTAENPNWWKTAGLENLGAYWGGETAAARLTEYLKPANCTLYVKPEKTKETLRELVAKYRLRADPNGDIEILDAFWNLPDTPDHPDVVPPILAYADMVATLDPRNLEVAKLIREQHIDHALRWF
jgi:hypothetical protein